ncbi:MAG: sensor histidine kinase [Cyclobacteriaceae bacterium]|jgi:two-component system LytT family sensor kinase|nr:sensor histidine kinase [Flammeovirgaceae bacterium]
MQRVRNHLLFWLAYVVFKTYLNITADWSGLIPATTEELEKYLQLLVIQLTLLIVKVPLVYVCFYVLDQFLNARWNLFQSILSLVIAFAVGLILMTVLNHTIILHSILHYTGDSGSWFNLGSLFYHFFTLLFVTGTACSLKLLRKQFQSRMREMELKKENTEAELKYLKGQINPHFLFNTLNNIYSLARKNSEQTADAVMKLSKLMRFMLYEASHEDILLLQEIKLIGDYIELEKLRYSNRLTIQFETDIDNPAQRIAPLILIHFVENAFKHGVGESRFESSILIRITLQNGVLKALIENSVEANQGCSEVAKIGLANIKRQLQLLYPRHQLDITQTEQFFKVALTIPLPV